MIKPNYLIVRRNKRKKKRQNYLYAEKTYGDKVESLLEQEEEEEEQYRERSFEETEEYEEEEEYKEEYMHDREEEALPTQQQSSVNGKKEKEEISKSKQRNKKRKVHQRANYTNRLYVTCSSIETNNIMENNYKTNTLNKEEHEKERSLENNDDEGTCDNKSNGYENETIYSEPENINNNDEEQRKHLLCNEMELKSSELIAVNDNSNNSISARELNERNDSCVNESKTTSLNTLSHNVNNINKRNELTLTKYEQEEEYEQEEGGEEEKAHTSSVNNTVCLLRKKFNHDNNKELEYLEEEEECEQVTEEKETSQSHLLNNTLLHDCKGVIDTNSSISNYNYKAYYSDEDVEFIKNVLKAPEPLSELPMKLQRISKSCIEEKLKERRRSLHSVTTSSSLTKTSNAESNASIRNNNNNNNNSNINNNSEYSHKLELDTTTINGNIDAKCELKSTDRINVEITTANAAELNSSLELLPRESEQQYYSSCASSLTNLSSSHKTTSLSSLTSPLSALSTASSYSPSNRRVSLTSVKNAPTIIKKLDENAINTFYDDFDDNDNNYDNNNDNEEQEEQEEDEIEEKEDDDQEVNAEDDDVTWNVAQLHVQARKGNRRGSSNNENSNNKNKSNNNNKSSQVDFNEYNGEHTQNHNNSDNANTLVYRCHVDPFASYECERGVEKMYNSHGTHRFSQDEHYAEIITNNDSINNNVCNSSNGETLHNEETECHSSTLGLTSNTGNTNLSTFSTNNSNTTNTNVKDQYELLSPPCTLQYSNCFTLPHIGESNLFHNENIIYNAQSSIAPHLPLTGLNINTDFNKISVSNDDSDNHNNDNNNNNNTCEFANWQHSQSELDNEEYLNWQSPRSFHQRTPCMIEMEDSPNTVRLLSSDGTEMILHTSYRDNSNKDECDVNSINNINNNNYSNSSNNYNSNSNNIVELETCTEVNSVDLPSGNGASNTCMFNEQDNANILHPEEIQKEETNECLSDKEKMKQDCLEEKQIKDTITKMEFCNRRMSKELIVFDFQVNKMEECNTEVEHRDNNAVLASEQTTVTLRDKEICESETTVLQSHNKCCLPLSTHVLNLCAEFLNRLEDRRCTLESEEALRKWEETEMHDNKLNRDVDMEDEISNDSFVNTVKITLDSHNINNNINNNNNNNKCINDDTADFTSSTSLLMTSVQHAQDSMTHQLLTHIPASPLTQPLISLLPEWEIEYLYKDVLEYAEQEIAQLRVLSAICPEFDFSCPAMSLRMMKTQMSKMKDDEKNDINENDNNNSNSSSGSSSGNDKIDNAKANTMLENNDFTNEDNNNNNNDNSREGDVINSFSNNISSAETISEKNNGVKSDSKGAKKLRSILQTPIPPKSGMKTIIELMKLAKVLQIVELSNLCAACMADYMLRCAFLEEDCFTAAQSIRSAFNIENDFTNKERDCLVIENEWPANEN